MFLVCWGAVWFFFGSGWPIILVTAIYLGFTVGQAFGYRWGLDDRERISDHVFGKGWQADAVRGRIQRQIKETAPWN